VAGVDARLKFDHVVSVMFENRSFPWARSSSGWPSRWIPDTPGTYLTSIPGPLPASKPTTT